MHNTFYTQVYIGTAIKFIYNMIKSKINSTYSIMMQLLD